MEPPTLKDVIVARKRIRPHLHKTPLHTYPQLNQHLGFTVYLKHENHQPTGAYKVRGGINLISQLTPQERKTGVITASTGNHGQSIALASQLYGVTAHVCVPEGANPDKVASIKAYGATIHQHGRDFDEARENAEQFKEDHPDSLMLPGVAPALD